MVGSRSLSAFAGFLLSLGLAAPAVGGRPPFENPPFLDSVGGVLQTTLDAAPAEIMLGNKSVTSNVFNGVYTPPVLRLMQGDVLRIEQINNMAEWQLNFHAHGTTTSPQGNGDNVFVRVLPGETFDTEIPIPPEHPSGMYWFHPHVHGFVNNTISNGMTGAILIGDILAPFPELAGITEQVMLLKDMKIKKGLPVDDPDPSGRTRRTINGLFKPVITIAPGELQFWRVGNLSANIFYDLVMKGVSFHILAVDGHLQTRIVETDRLVMPPGRRFEVLVRGPDKKKKYKLKTKRFNTGPQGDSYPSQVMATLKVTGDPVDPIPLPTVFPGVTDLRLEAVDVNRTVVFDDTDDPNVFVIDGKVYDESRVDQLVQLGDVEEWVLQNASAEFHVFHIHQGEFQVVSINGEAQPFTGYEDIVNLPAATKEAPGEVVIRIRFDPPIIVGEYVYHCHIVQHEDQGMMANIVVEDQLAELMKAGDPPDLIAQALTPAEGNYWCL